MVLGPQSVQLCRENQIMRSYLIVTCSAAVALLFTATSAVEAQNTSSIRANQNRNNNAAIEKTVRASEIIGMNIYNSQGKDLGEVNDVVIDPNTGKVSYAAVTYGGFLGIGDKMFAVPWEAFQCTVDPDDPEEHRLTLDVNKSQLEGAEGFDQDNWPDFGDPNFANDLDRRYKVDRNRVREGNRQGNLGVDVNRDGVNVDVNRQKRNQ